MMKKLNVGCGREIKKGWINADRWHKQKTNIWFKDQIKAGYYIIKLDVTEPWDFEDNSVDYINSEHMIEHLHEPDGLFFLKEAFRVLKPGGVIRTIAPNKTFYETIGGQDFHPFTVNYCKKIFNRDSFLGAATRIATRTLNEQGHYWVPTPSMLVKQHVKAGFSDVKTTEYNVSEHAELNGNDLVDGIREYESVVVEGTKA